MEVDIEWEGGGLALSEWRNIKARWMGEWERSSWGKRRRYGKETCVD